MSILSNGNVYDCYPQSGPLPRLETCNEGSGSGQVPIVTIRLPDGFGGDWEPIPAPPIQTPPVVIVAPPPITVHDPPAIVPDPVDPPATILDPDPIPTLTPCPLPTSSIPEPSALYLVGPGLILVFVGARKARAK